MLTSQRPMPSRISPRSGNRFQRFFLWWAILGSPWMTVVAQTPENANNRALSPNITPNITPIPSVSFDDRTMRRIELGKTLFFDPRLSGDATIHCGTCHVPEKAFTDGMELSQGYPGTLYFRNTPTLLNTSLQRRYYWDGRLSGDDLASVIRDHLSEAHFMQADGRLIIERLNQVPEYETAFRRAFDGEPTYGRILKSLAALVRSLRSGPTPVDRFLDGDDDALDAHAKRGWTLFRGKAQCIRCHHGPLLSDQKLHVLGVPENPRIFSDPERHITFRRFLRTIGVAECRQLRQDIGLECVTKDPGDRGRFRTPSLREVAQTAPYMHNGKFATLRQVVEFYNQGSGADDVKQNANAPHATLDPLGMNDSQMSDLVHFLQALSSETPRLEPVPVPGYQIRQPDSPAQGADLP